MREATPRLNARQVTKSIRISQGKCIDVMTGEPDGRYDVIVTSPPYNKGVQYDVCRDDLPYEDYPTWTERWMD